MAKKKLSRSKLVKKADSTFSHYIRQRNADENGMTECFTCGKQDHWKKLQCGHFMSRKHYSTRWHEQNCQVQCAGCNVFRYGEQYTFGRNLDIHIKNGLSEELNILSKQILKYSNIDLIELEEKYKEKLASL
tara:strand:- start:11135 stop:11530 length:396 start_codon:yes stop_codon:yes gene_type:complete